jgi:cell division protein FtsL
MDQKEKQIIVTLCSTILILGLYSLHVYNKYIAVNPEIINSFKFWGSAIVILIPITIVAQIIIHIIFVIINKMVTNEEMPTTDDERDKLIELKSTRISHWIFTVGFILAMGSQAIAMKPWVMFVTLISSGFVSSIISEISRFSFYRKGV